MAFPATLPSSTGYATENAFGSLTFSAPVCVTTPPNVTDRVFVVEQAGTVQMVNTTTNTKTLFFNIADIHAAMPLPRPIQIPGGECGMLGMAFHPNYNTNGYIYIFHSVTINSSSQRHQRIARLQANGTAGNYNAATSVIVTSYSPIITQRDEDSHHNGGDMHFGPDGYLYFSAGDEGAADDSFDNSRRIAKDFFGAIFRIDVDSKPGNLTPNAHSQPNSTTHPSAVHAGAYLVPADNPFVNLPADGSGNSTYAGFTFPKSSVRTEIYAIGLRNPWRMSFDRPTGRLFVADVGQAQREEINIVTNGFNGGWGWREGTASKTPATAPSTPPAGLVLNAPIYDYGRSGGDFSGGCVTGGVVYRGTRLSEIAGDYIFGDYNDGKIWSLRQNGSTWIPTRLLTLSASTVSAFGADPGNGDILICELASGVVKRLVRNFGGTPPPATLSATGAFSDLATLTPATGVVAYDINLPFWSDHAIKTRWFSIPSATPKMTFSQDGSWTYPDGQVWIKHFDLEMTRGNPSTKKRIETRFIVKNSAGVYGLTYKWRADGTNADLVGETGMNETLSINVGGVPTSQVWRYPSRSECTSCHNVTSGFALGFTTRQFNRLQTYGSQTQNQISALAAAGYFSNSVGDVSAMPAHPSLTDTSVSREARVRAYLDVNCAQCHRPGGGAQGNWDARVTTATADAGIINGALVNNGGDTANRFMVPGDVGHSVVLNRLQGTGGFNRMPPVGSSVTDTAGVQLLTDWITEGLPVSLTAPANGTNYVAPATIAMSANASGGSVARVEFYNGTTLLGQDVSSPYSFSWSGVAAGTYSLTARAYDNLGAYTTSAAVSVTVSATNTPPTISDIPNSATNEDTATAAIAFTVGDSQTTAGSLTVSGSSSNQTLIPNANIALGGSGANRTVTLTPAPNQSGTATITIGVSDGVASTNDTFTVTAAAVNDAPTISDISNQSTASGTSTTAIAFSVGDVETVSGSLTVSGQSSNVTLVPNSNVSFGGSGASRTVTVTPASGQSGTATITVTVSDGSLSTSDTFSLTVTSGTPGSSTTFANSVAHTIPDYGKSSNYPATIPVSGLSGTISSITATISGITHSYPDDLDILLVSPTGQKVLLMSDTGGGYATSGVTLTFSDAAASNLPDTVQLATGTFKPSNYNTGDTFVSPAPVAPYASMMSEFVGQDPNGTWSLYVLDDGHGGSGTISGGWSLTITTQGSGDPPVNSAPTISDIANQSTTSGTATGAISFTVGDAETAAGSLTVSGISSNATLVPSGNITFGGSGASRTVTVTPASGQSGTATITVTVSDGSLSANDAFVLTVAPNSAPTISNIADQSFNEDGSSGVLAFTVGDSDTSLTSLTLTGNSSNTGLVPNANIVLGGSGANRTVMVTPAANQTGSTMITISVSDGQSTVTDTFIVNVAAVNDVPTISDIANQSTASGTSTGAIAFAVGDVETAAGSLTVSGQSSNVTLVPNANITFGGSGANRTVTVTPASGQSGTATITVTVSDGSLSTSDPFSLTVTSGTSGSTMTFANPGAFTIPDYNKASSYPAMIAVSGLSGTISSITATLTGITHSYPDDIDILLVSPTGQKMLLMSDTGGGYPVNGVTLTFSDAAGSFLPDSAQLVNGTFKPSEYRVGDTFVAPAPAAPYAATMSAFAGQDPNGTWSLYVIDDGHGGEGTINGGWSLTITTQTSGASPLVNTPDTTEPDAPDAHFTLRIMGQTEEGGTQLRIVGGEWEKYDIERSEDLVNWTILTTVSDETGISEFVDPDVTIRQKCFYRLKWRP